MLLIQQKKDLQFPIIKEIIKNFSNQEIIVMGRYTSQVRHLDQTFGKKIRVFNKIVDSKILLENARRFRWIWWNNDRRICTAWYSYNFIQCCSKYYRSLSCQEKIGDKR